MARLPKEKSPQAQAVVEVAKRGEPGHRVCAALGPFAKGFGQQAAGPGQGTELVKVEMVTMRSYKVQAAVVGWSQHPGPLFQVLHGLPKGRFGQFGAVASDGKNLGVALVKQRLKCIGISLAKAAALLFSLVDPNPIDATRSRQLGRMPDELIEKGYPFLIGPSWQQVLVSRLAPCAEGEQHQDCLGRGYRSHECSGQGEHILRKLASFPSIFCLQCDTGKGASSLPSGLKGEKEKFFKNYIFTIP